MTPQIDRQTAEDVHHDGIVCLRQVFDQAWVKELRRLADVMLNAEDRHPVQPRELSKEGDDGWFFNEMFIWPRNGHFKKVIFESPASAIAGTVIGSTRVNILFDQLLIKEPGTLEPTTWHQDISFWPFQGDQVCTIWLALDVVTAQFGVVEYVRGSHRWGKRYQPELLVGGRRYQQHGLDALPYFCAMRSELDIISFEMASGDCTVHHGLTVHSAPGNSRTDRRRRAYVTRLAEDDVIYDPREGTQPVLHNPELQAGDSVKSALWPVISRVAA